MSESEMQDRVPNWDDIPGPRYYHPAEVEPAIALLTGATSKDADPGASFRSAVGNDHAGTLYPAAVAATIRLLDIIEHRPGPPRRAALGVLLDWWGTFRPEPGYESFQDRNGVTVELLPALIGEVAAAKPVIENIPGSDPGASGRALKLLECIEAGWVPFDPRY